MSYKFISDLEKIIKEKKKDNPKDSYVARMFGKGLDKIAQKVGEEAVETVIASKNDDNSEFIYESADLFFHLLLLCEIRGIPFEEIIKELKSRNKVN
jgi:phosphoribosyl-ATP pyrophosphohydrolase/phosphoribosyl-AMP cyclohydrolase